MTELTKEQIAQGWIAYTGNGEPPFKKEVNGPPFQIGRMHDGELCTTIVITESLPDEIDWSNVAAYRVWVPSLPSPPVSGEAFTDPDSIFYGASIEEAIETGTWFWQLGRGPMSVSQGGFASFDGAKADLRRLLTGSIEKTPLVNKEWFGVTISLELAEDIRAALEDLGACPDDECTQCKRVLPRLSAAIGERG